MSQRRPQVEHGRTSLRTVTYADTKSEDISWLWSGRIARAKVNVLIADGGVGKSLFTCRLAAGVTKGELTAGVRDPGRVLLVNMEDAASDTTRPRLESQGADLRLIDRLDDTAGETLILPGDHMRLREAVLSAQYRLVVLDPIAACLSPSVSFALDASIRSAIMPLARLAAESQAAFLLVHHLNGRLNASAYRRLLGGTALANVARSVYAIGVHPDDRGNPNGRRVIAFVKGNLAGRDTSSVECRLDETGKLQFGAVVPITADELLTERRGRGSSRAAPDRDDAVRFLLDELASGAVDSAELEARAAARGIALRTYDRARGVVGVVPERRGRGWASRLPHEVEAQAPSVASAGSAEQRTTPVRPVERVPTVDDATVRFSLIELDLEDAKSGGVLDPSSCSEALAPRTPSAETEQAHKGTA